jgi:hypothetical protein
MAVFTVKQIQDFAIDLLSKSPQGMRFRELCDAILAASPDSNTNTVGTQVVMLVTDRPSDVKKPARGLYLHAKFAEPPELAPSLKPSAGAEKDYYESFALWISKEKEEVTEARALGGSSLKQKWGTPDVVGVYRNRFGDLVKFPPEYMAAEVKIDASQSIVAFGQAVAYRLFAHRAYIVLPRTVSQEDRDRTVALGLLLGIGVVFFDLNPTNPNYSLDVRAQRHDPDPFYLNEFARTLHQSDRSLAETLFGV